jgi:hypothetical protein
MDQPVAAFTPKETETRVTPPVSSAAAQRAATFHGARTVAISLLVDRVLGA